MKLISKLTTLSKKSVSKVIALSKAIIISIVSTLPLPASAIIIEGSFHGRMWEWQSENMEGTPDGKFFTQENAFTFFSGTFWYDTDLATKVETKPTLGGSESATYSGPHDWLHTTVTGANGGSFEFTSSGGSETFIDKPDETISVRPDLFELRYDDNYYRYPRDPDRGYRASNLLLEPGGEFFDELSLVQNQALESTFDVLGYLEFQTSGTLNGIEYSAWMVGEINGFEIRAQTPEPSPLILFIAPLLFLLSRAGLIANPFSRKI